VTCSYCCDFVSFPKKIIEIARVPRLRASPRHGGAGRFFRIFSFFERIRKFLKIAPQKVDKKYSEKIEEVRGSRGYSPWVASPLGGERGSLS